MQTTYEPQTAGIIEPSSQQGGYGIGLWHRFAILVRQRGLYAQRWDDDPDVFPRTIGRNLPRTGEALWRWMRLVVLIFCSCKCYVFWHMCLQQVKMCSLSLCLWVYMNRCIYTKVLDSYKDGWRCAEICLHMHECLDTLQPCCQMIRKLPRSVDCLGMRWCHANGRLPKMDTNLPGMVWELVCLETGSWYSASNGFKSPLGERRAKYKNCWGLMQAMSGHSIS